MYKFIYKNLKKVREKYIDTLAKLYEFSTTVYSKKQFTQWADSKNGGYTYADLKHRSDAL